LTTTTSYVALHGEDKTDKNFSFERAETMYDLQFT